MEEFVMTLMKWYGNGLFRGKLANGALVWACKDELDVLVLIKGTQVRKFRGKAIPGFCQVIEGLEVRNVTFYGSRTIYRLQLEQGVDFFADNKALWYALWRDERSLAEMLGVPDNLAEKILHHLRPSREQLRRIEYEDRAWRVRAGLLPLEKAYDQQISLL